MISTYMRDKFSIKKNIYKINQKEELIFKTKIIKKSNNSDNKTLNKLEEILRKKVEEDLDIYLKNLNEIKDKKEKPLTRISENQKNQFKKIFLDVIYFEIRNLMKN